jgi:hypothetical protein
MRAMAWGSFRKRSLTKVSADWSPYRIHADTYPTLQNNRKTIMDDPFIRNYIEDLLKNIRTQVLLKLIKPYTRIRIPFVSKAS